MSTKEKEKPVEKWEERFRSILDNYMPNENIRNLLMREIKSLLSSDRERVRAGVEKLAAYESYRAEGDLDPLISKRDVLHLLTTPQQ